MIVPILPSRPWEDTRALAQTTAQAMQATHPDRYTVPSDGADRVGKVFIDHRKNAMGRGVLSPYSPCFGTHAPISTPLAWQELRSDLDPDALSIVGVPIRLDRLAEDPWAEFFVVRQRLQPDLLRRAGIDPAPVG